MPQGYEYLPLPKMPVKDIPADTVSVEPEVAQQDEKKEEREILSAIITYKDIEWNDDHILKKLVQRFGLKEDEALEYMIKAG